MRLVLSSGIRRLRAPATINNRRLISTTQGVLSQGKHSPDTYSKEADSSPASDKTINKLDPESEAVQRPHDPPSGEYSRAGVKSEEYHNVEGENEPYTPKGGSKGNYGAMGDWKEQKGSETSKSEDGPDGKSSRGRGA
ncbi:hypothetical protein CPB83DRAFT_862485 [Crepidotus variabilis]|uniref:Uncharacterized protein n=1 Tax=Crepidotus variabilis TaxID=179855 RepID=A0A9P6E7B8_9AGAR|nr:hypothetical protein CPB83DRAFT_862485 [Crepidotus variabilis]